MSEPVVPNKTPKQPGPPFRPRQVRIFISSTFRDLVEERNHLMTHVFPELRRKTGCPPASLELVIAGRPLGTLHHIIGRGIEGKKAFKFIQKQRPIV